MKRMVRLSKKPTASELVRMLKTSYDGARYSYFYNDKTSFGRSIKVTGWDLQKYEIAKLLLERHGYQVKLRKLKSWPMSRYTRKDTSKYIYRLHVIENA